ncbi:uncharacterized protein LOC62_03G004339 [Vanrija pseudolonga]|uniref:Uncharacterized protein n=1 Tax=Vanrija pseudolonga TaxID=143232 RepID=A0AAF0YA26_9TREE|nr:hypothetical protein LOC62_03G004339 [Vanrija pseudolonga]
MTSTHPLTHSPVPQPAKKLRPCLSPTRFGRSITVCETQSIHVAISTSRSPSVASTSSSIYTEASEGLARRPSKSVRWKGEDGTCDVSSYSETWSATEYDRTPLAPPSEEERACVLPARGSRCLSTLWNGGDADDAAEADEESDDVYQPPSPFATPEDSDSDADCEEGDEWSECFARRQMMFARMCPLGRQPQFEGYRSLSQTLTDLLRSVGADSSSEEEDADEVEGEDDAATTPRVAHTPVGDSTEEEDEDESEPEDHGFPITGLTGLTVTSASSFPFTDLFHRLRESSEDSDDPIGTPSLISSADSDGEHSRLASPRGSAVDFLPGGAAVWKGVSPVRVERQLAPTTDL